MFEFPGKISTWPARAFYVGNRTSFLVSLELFTEIGKKAWRFAKLQPGRARKRINATLPPPFSRAL